MITTARPPAKAAASRRRRHIRYALAISCLLVLAGTTQALPIFRGQLRAYLGVDERLFGLILGAGPMAGVLPVLAAGLLVRRIGAVRMVRWGLLGVGAGMALLAAAGDSWPLVLGGCAICGCSYGPLNIAASAYMARLFPGNQRRVLAMSLALSGVGGLLVPQAVEGLLKLAAGGGISFAHAFHVPYALLACALIAGSLLYRSSRAPAEPLRSSRFPRLRFDINWRDMLLPLPGAWIVALLAMHGAADNALGSWMPTFLDRPTFRNPPIVPGAIISACSLAYVLSRSVLAALPERFGRRVFLVLPGLAGGTAVIAGILSGSFWMAAGGYVVGSLLWSAEYPSMLGVLAVGGKRSFAPAMALMQAASYLLGAGHLRDGRRRPARRTARDGAGDGPAGRGVPARWRRRSGVGACKPWAVGGGR